MVKQRRLLWVAVGAGLASLAWLIAYFSLAYATRDNRFFNIMAENNEELQRIVIAAVGECRGRFKMDTTSEGTIISIPMNSLSDKGKICLFEKLNKGVWIEQKDTGRPHDGKVLVRPDIYLGDKM